MGNPATGHQILTSIHGDTFGLDYLGRPVVNREDGVQFILDCPVDNSHGPAFWGDANGQSLVTPAGGIVQLAGSGSGGVSQAVIDAINVQLQTEYTLAVNRANHVGYDTPHQTATASNTQTVSAADSLPGAWGVYSQSTQGQVILPLNANVSIPIGASVRWFQIGTGQFSVVGQTSAVSVLPPGLILSGFQGAKLEFYKIGTDAWVVAGNLASTAAPFNQVPPSIVGDGTSPKAGTVLTRTAGVWVGTPSPTVTGAWFKNGVTTGTTTSTYTTVNPTDVGNVFTWVDSAVSTAGGPVTATSNSITITDATAGAPIGSAGSVVLSGSPVVNGVLSLSNGTWTNTPTSYAYAWYSNGVAIAGATSQTFTVQPAQSGTSVYGTVLATGAGGTAITALQSNTVQITSAAPTISASSAPALYDATNQLVQGVTLAIDYGSWNGNPVFTQVWQVADLSGNVTVLSGTGSSLVTTVSGYYSAVITGTNTGGAVVQTTPNVFIAVSSSLPVNTVAPSVTPATGVGIGTLLTCAPGTWTNSPTFTYLWRRNTFINLGTGSTYTTVAGDNGQNVDCFVTATNGGLSQGASSNVVIPSGGVAGVLSGAATVMAGPAAMDSTDSVDYLIFSTNSSLVTKSGGGSLIGHSTIGGATPTTGSFAYTIITCTGGTPTATVTTETGWATTWGDPTNAGIRLTFPIGTANRIVDIYLDTYNQAVNVAASLSDSSATPVTLSADSGSNASLTATRFRFTGNAASASQTLTVDVKTNQAADGAGQIYVLAAGINT